MTLFFEGGFDGSGHVVLAATVLESEGGAGEDASWGEEVVEAREGAGGVEVLLRLGGDLDGRGHGGLCP